MSPRRFRLAWLCVPLFTLALILPSSPAHGQEITDDMVGQNEIAWQVWSTAMQFLERGKFDDAKKGFDAIADMKLSDLRLALMADRTGTLRFEEAVKDDKLGEAGKKLLAQITNGRRQRQLAEDGYHFAAIGRFNYADANFKALVDSNPDPVALLELSRYNPARTQTLVRLVANADVGESAKLVLKILQEGERELRTDPAEIEVNIERLGGPPRVVYEATNNLKASGEYAIPHLIAYLQNPKKRDLHPAIMQLLPLMGRSALNPMVQAIQMKDQVTREVLIRALGAIGYAQAAPYLARVASADKSASSQVRTAAAEALSQVNKTGTNDPAVLFRMLAEGYYDDAESLAADPRIDDANVWYWDEAAQELRFIPVPRAIFNDVMAMRSAEAALQLANTDAESIALWLAANFRREAKLGMDVESEAPSPLAEKDATRPENYPRSIYFARAAGPLYNHMALWRAVKDREAGVALGTIAALAATAGPVSLVGPEDYKQALIKALEFPSRLVRTKAALALARSLPTSEFAGAQNVIPALAEALGQSGQRVGVIVDPDNQTRNEFQALLRAMGYEVFSDASLFTAMEQARKANVPGIDAQTPTIGEAVKSVRDKLETSAVPIVIVSKPQQTAAAADLAVRSKGVETVVSDVLKLDAQDKIEKTVAQRLADASAALGMKPLDAAHSVDLALQAADALRLIGVARSSVFDLGRAEGALVGALAQPNEALRIKAASVLALIGSPGAQKAIAQAALDEKNSKTQRIAAFESLADSARLNGNKLDSKLVEQVVRVAETAGDLDIRTAASQALGALNLTNNQASEIIRAQSRG
jgi:hypothetical protein